MSANVVEIFANFLILRLWLPGTLFVFLYQLLAIDLFNIPYNLSNSDIFIWIITPLLAGKFFHLINASISLWKGFEQIKPGGVARFGAFFGDVQEIQNRINGRNVYKKEDDPARKIFFLAQVYANCFLVFVALTILNILNNGLSIKSTVFLLCGAFLSYICASYNYQYGRCALLLSKYDN